MTADETRLRNHGPDDGGIPRGSGSPAAELVRFYLLALAISWSAWVPLAAGRLGWIAPQPAWLHLAGSLGPALAALIVARGQGRLEALLAMLSPRRLGGAALALAVLVPAGIGAVGLAAQALIERTPIRWSLLLTSEEFPGFSPPVLILCAVIFYGLGEEIGWRGFLLPRLLQRIGPFGAALLVTLPWGLWHLPLLLSNPTYQALGLAGLGGWLFSLLTGSLLMTWLFLTQGRSLIALALFHATLDLVMVNPATSPLGVNIMGGLVTMAGLAAAIWAWRASRRVARARAEWRCGAG